MAWFRVSTKRGSSVVVQAESRQAAVKELWNALEELSRGAVEALRLGSYVVSEERGVALENSYDGGELRALVYAPRSERPSQAQRPLSQPQGSRQLS